MTRYDRVGKVIHWELCKRLKLEHANKWYVHKPESVLSVMDFADPADHRVKIKESEKIDK